jgi:hypothetical protein
MKPDIFVKFLQLSVFRQNEILIDGKLARQYMAPVLRNIFAPDRKFSGGEGKKGTEISGGRGRGTIVEGIRGGRRKERSPAVGEVKKDQGGGRRGITVEEGNNLRS